MFLCSLFHPSSLDWNRLQKAVNTDQTLLRLTDLDQSKLKLSHFS